MITLSALSLLWPQPWILWAVVTKSLVIIYWFILRTLRARVTTPSFINYGMMQLALAIASLLYQQKSWTIMIALVETCCYSLGSATPSNFYSNPAPNSVPGSQGVLSSVADATAHCDRCGRTNHLAHDCFASFCANCHERLYTKVPHNSNTCSTNPSLTQDVTGLGIRRGYPGSTLFQPLNPTAWAPV